MIRIPAPRQASATNDLQPPEEDKAALRKRRTLKLLDMGVSTRDIEAGYEELFGEPGPSRETASRWQRQLHTAELKALNSRGFENEPIVAVVLDGTAVDGITVMIAVGVTADGRKLALGTGVAQHEKKEHVRSFLEQIVQRGVDPNVLWVTDGGPGIKWALQQISRDSDPCHQLCTVHARRKILEKLPAEMHKEIEETLYAAWDNTDAEVALKGLENLTDELRKGGHESAANSLEFWRHDALTVTRLGLEGDLHRQFRSTNLVESINGSVKEGLRNVKYWQGKEKEEEKKEGGKEKEEEEKDGKETDERKRKRIEMRLRWVAHQLTALEAKTWTRVADPQALVGVLLKRLTLGRHDPEAILAKVPPNLTVRPVAVPFEEDHKLRKFATSWCDAVPVAVWRGSPQVLEALGVTAFDRVEPEELMHAMRGRKAGTDVTLRTPAQIKGAQSGPDGERVEAKVAGVRCLSWELAASPMAMREWAAAGPERREEIEGAMLRGAEAAIARVTSTTQAQDGSAGVFAIQRPPADAPEQPLRVVGVTVGVMRGKGAKKLGSPVPETALDSATARAAEDAAKEVLDEALKRETPEQAVPDPERHAVRSTGAPPSPALVAAAEELAIGHAPWMVAATPEQVTERAGMFDEAVRELGKVNAEVTAWLGTNQEAAARQIAAARERAARERAEPPRGVWHPLGRVECLVLGEERARWLLGKAEILRGRASADPQLAGELRTASQEPLNELREILMPVELAAEAIAAQRELQRRELFAAVREPAVDEEAMQEVPLRDRRGNPVAEPIARYGHALGKERVEDLNAYAEAVKEELVKVDMDEPALHRLAAATTDSWRELDASTGLKFGSKERDRDAALTETLKQSHILGQCKSQLEQAGHDGTAIKAADIRRNKAFKESADRLAEVEKAEAELDELRQRRGNPEQFVAQNPGAALNSAALSLLLEREQQRATGQELAGGREPELVAVPEPDMGLEV